MVAKWLGLWIISFWCVTVGYFITDIITKEIDVAYVWKDNGRGDYVANVRDLIGKDGGLKRFQKRKDAVEYINKVKAEQARHGIFVDPHRTPLLIDAIPRWATSQYAAAHRGEHQQKSARAKELALEQIAEIFCGPKQLKYRRVGEVRPSLMRDVCNAFAETLNAQQTLRRKWGYCVQFWDWCVEADWISENPAKFSRGAGMRLPLTAGGEDKKPLRLISKEIIHSITEAASEDVRLAIKVAWGTGIRQGELRALQWGVGGLDTTAGILHVTRAFDGDKKIGLPKTDLGRREVPLAPALLSELREWRIAQPPEQRKNNLVFPSPTGGVIDDRALRERGLYRACERAGVDLIRWHDLRHYFASALLFDPSFTDATVTQLLGHHSISFTLSVYGHWMADKKRDAGIAEALGRAL